MSGAPFALAVTDGILAAANPCGFDMLPAFVSLLLVTGQTTGRDHAIVAGSAAPGLALIGAMTLGFAAFFGASGWPRRPRTGWPCTCPG